MRCTSRRPHIDRYTSVRPYRAYSNSNIIYIHHESRHQRHLAADRCTYLVGARSISAEQRLRLNVKFDYCLFRNYSRYNSGLHVTVILNVISAHATYSIY